MKWNQLSNKQILLGVSGGIAAYKTPELVRLLKKSNAEVMVTLTPSAMQFVTPATLGTVSENSVLTEIFPANPSGSWTVHIHTARKSDLFLIAPATANTIAKLANGLADNMLTNLYLAFDTQKPVVICPAMDTDMWLHPATQRNIEILKERGHIIIPPEDGLLASGLSGPGRLPEPETIVSQIDLILKKKDTWAAGKTVVVTAGPTVEPIDPVRFISNHSSGKMGYAIADEAQRLGAKVILISGPVQLPSPPHVHLVPVKTAYEMAQAVFAHSENADILIFSAAVSDYRPLSPQTQKIKKNEPGNELKSLELEKNIDILETVGKNKKPGQFIVGFALETQDEIRYGTEKLLRKNCDLMVVNNPMEEGAGFGTDTNKVTFIDKTGILSSFGPVLKQQVAYQLFEQIKTRLKSEL